MKKYCNAFVGAAVCAALVGGGAFAANSIWAELFPNEVTVYVNGERVEADNFVYNDRTYIPLREVSERLGASVDYNGETNDVDVSLPGGDYIREAALINEAYDGLTYCANLLKSRRQLMSDAVTALISSDANKSNLYYQYKDMIESSSKVLGQTFLMECLFLIDNNLDGKFPDIEERYVMINTYSENLTALFNNLQDIADNGLSELNSYKINSAIDACVEINSAANGIELYCAEKTIFYRDIISR
jgi:hypothetical protein